MSQEAGGSGDYEDKPAAVNEGSKTMIKIVVSFKNGTINCPQSMIKNQ
jgi:hypothetical protein